MAECPKCHGRGRVGPLVGDDFTPGLEQFERDEQQCQDCRGLGEVTWTTPCLGERSASAPAESSGVGVIIFDPNSLGQLIIQLETAAWRLAQKADEVRKSAQHFVEPMAAYKVIEAQAYEEAARLLEARAAVYSQQREAARKRQSR